MLGQAKKLHDKFVLAPQLESALASDSLELFADDLVRGYRINVRDSASSRWKSLMRRTGTYAIGSLAPIPSPPGDEGFIGTTATKKPLSDDLYVSEEVFWWDGWSLVAPRPGRTLNIDPQAQDPLMDRPANDPGPDFKARFRFDVTPGTLPSLRYGTSYRLRARTVDLAGNSHPFTAADDTHATAEVRFGRFQPPQTPPVLMRNPPGPGESMETVCVRSNFDTEANADAVRIIAPPKVAHLTVEQHRHVDVADPNRPGQSVLDLTAYSALATRERGHSGQPSGRPT